MIKQSKVIHWNLKYIWDFKYTNTRSQVYFLAFWLNVFAKAFEAQSPLDASKDLTKTFGWCKYLAVNLLRDAFVVNATFVCQQICAPL